MDTNHLFKDKVLGHPSGLFVLFFTEMWERFSYYGMRAILVIFLTGALTGDNPGWGWDKSAALSLLGTYALFVYLTPLVGGWLADHRIGYRRAVVIGALLMTLGHGSMAFETPSGLFVGIAFLILGNGFFKPNMTSIISKMYLGRDDKKDGAYNIFYMGVNAGAFIGIMLCGWMGENIGWGYGFGLAGIFMLLGMIQFYYAQPIFGSIGDPPLRAPNSSLEGVPVGDNAKLDGQGKKNPFLTVDYLLIGVFSLCSLVYVINDPLYKIGGITIFNLEILGLQDSLFFALSAAISFLVLLMLRIPRYEKIVRERMIAFAVFCLFTIFFWVAFEQAAGSLPLYTRDFTNRVLSGSAAILFKWIDAVITVVPLAVITYVLYALFKQTFTKIRLSNLVLAGSFLLVWVLVIYKLYINFSNDAKEIEVTWFAILNSLFIILFAPLFTKWWDSAYNPPAAMKYGLGLVTMASGFGLLAYATKDVPLGAQSASLSMGWLVMAYLLHTLGELCLSPMGLSYLSKLVPPRMIAFMFGVFYLAIAIGNKLAHYIGGNIDSISRESGLSHFFLIFTIWPMVIGILSFAMHPLLKRWMHEVR